MINLLDFIFLLLIIYPIIRNKTFPVIELLMYLFYKLLTSYEGHVIHRDNRFLYLMVFIIVSVSLKWYVYKSIVPTECIAVVLFVLSMTIIGKYSHFYILHSKSRNRPPVAVIANACSYPLINQEWITHHLSRGCTVYIKSALTADMVRLLLPFLKENKSVYLIQHDHEMSAHKWIYHGSTYDYLYSKKPINDLLEHIPDTVSAIVLHVQTMASSLSYSPYRSLRSYTIPIGQHTEAVFHRNIHGSEQRVSEMYLVRYSMNVTPQSTLKSIHTEPHRLLNLIIYNPASEFERTIKPHLSDYLKTIPYLTAYFISLRDQPNEVEIEGDCMFIKGKETFIPGILDKTIKAMKYCVDINLPFTYFVRSNISTMINYAQFPFEELDDNRHHYAGPNISTVHDVIAGKDDGVQYIQGICIILTPQSVSHLLCSQLDYGIIDDVAIGKALSSNYPARELRQDRCHTAYQTISPHSIIFRNKSPNRSDDIVYMKQLIHHFTDL